MTELLSYVTKIRLIWCYISGLAFSCHTLRSVILPIAVAKNKMRADEAVRLSRLEIDFQVNGKLYKWMYIK